MDFRKILAKPHVDTSVGPSTEDQEIPHWRLEGGREVRRVGDAAEARVSPHILPCTAPERNQPAKLDSGQLWDVDDPICHNVMALVAAAAVSPLRNTLCRRESARERTGEVTQIVHAREVARRVCINEPGAPIDPVRRRTIRTIELQGKRVIPRFSVVRGIDDVVEAVRTDIEVDATVTGCIERDIGPVVGEKICSALSLIAQRCDHRPQLAPHADAPLRRLWWLRLVVDEEGFRLTGAPGESTN